MFRASFDCKVGSNGNYISKAQLNSISASSTGSLVNRFPSYSQKNVYYPNEQYLYYPSKIQLPSANQQPLMLGSPVRRLAPDGNIMANNLPWATLPRRFQHGSASSSPALNTTTNIPQDSKASTPLQHPSIDRVISQGCPPHFRETYTSSVRSSPNKTPSLHSEDISSSRRPVTSPAPNPTLQRKLSSDERMISEKPTPCYEPKEVSDCL